MSNNKRESIELNEQEIISWADSMAGASDVSIAKKLGIHRMTVAKYKKKVQAYIGDRMDLDNYKLPLFELYPLALRSLIVNLNEHDVQTTLQFFRGLGIFTERTEVEDVSRLSDTDLDALAQRIVGTAERGLADIGEDRPGETTATA